MNIINPKNHEIIAQLETTDPTALKDITAEARKAQKEWQSQPSKQIVL